MRIDVLNRRWGGPDGAPDGMSMAASYLAWTLCGMGHDVTGYVAGALEPPWKHPRMKWTHRGNLATPDDWTADLVISTISGVWRRTAVAARGAGAEGRCVFWHHYGGLPPGFGCRLATLTPMDVPADWSSAMVLPPSSWAAEGGGQPTGSEVLIPGTGRMKGGLCSVAVARLCPDLRFLVLPGRSGHSDLVPWKPLKNAELVTGLMPPAAFLARAGAVLSPTKAESYGLTLLEAAVRGIPVVCSDLPGPRAACNGSAVYLPESAPPEAWAKELRAAIASPPPPRVLPYYKEVALRVVWQHERARQAVG